MVVGLSVGTFWLYPVQTRGMSRFWQVMLPLMRVVAILAIGLSLLKPTLVRPRTQEEQGAVVVLVDKSASMGIADASMSPAQRVALADTLGLLPDGRRTRTAPEARQTIRRLQGLLERAARTQSDVDYARLTGRQVSRREADCDEAYSEAISAARDLATGLSKVGADDGVSAKIAALGGKPEAAGRGAWRKEVGESLGPIETMLESRQAQTDTALYNGDAAVRAECDKLANETRFRHVEQLLTREKLGLLAGFAEDVPLYGYSFADTVAPLPLRAAREPVKRLLAEPDGRQTRLSGAIAAALEDLKGRAVRGVIVFSDGRSVGESEAAHGLSGTVPVFTVACGEEKAYSDLSISAVEMPPSAYAGEAVTILARFKAVNIPPGEYDVTMSCGEERAARKVKLDANGTGQVECSFKPTKPGVSMVQVKAGVLKGEATALNNEFSRPLKVIQDKLSVLLLSSYASWDYQYVRNALSRTKWARLTDAMAADDRLSITPEQIGQQDVIVLFRLRPGMLSAQQIDALHRAVTEKGASLIMTAGASDDLEAFAGNPLLGELLPYRPGSKPVWRSWPGDRPAFRIVPEGTAQSMDALRLADDPAESASRWMNLPAVYHYLSIPQLKPNVIHTMLVEKESRLPVLVESRLGIGRVMFMGVQESWRWRMRVGERDQDRFWLQLIRYSAEEPYALVSEHLAMDLDKASARPGEDVRVRIRENARLADRKAPSIEISQNGKVVRVEQPAERGTMQPGRYDAVLRDLPEGTYDVMVRVPGEQGATLQMPLEVRYGLEEELGDVSPDRAALQQISSLSGGASMPLAEAGDLARQVSQLRHRYGVMIEIPLWTSGYLFTFVLGLLAVEWAVRKRLGLA